MDELITSELRERGFLAVSLSLVDAPLVEYQVTGLGGQNADELNEEWRVSGGVEGSFCYHLHGTLLSPECWRDNVCEVSINALGSLHRVEHEKAGFLGDGHCSTDGASFRLFLRPSIARDILDRLTVFRDSSGSIEVQQMRIDLVEVRESSAGPAVVGRVVRIFI